MVAADEPPLAMYARLKAFALSPSAARAENVVFKRDRIEMTFNGVFYPEQPVEGKVRGAVFVGSGSIRVEPPPIPYERDNLRRMLKAERVESDFKTAVLRFSDDTWKELALHESAGEAAPNDAALLAAGFSPHLLKETGLNPDARITTSILNHESPGLFLAQFDKGKLGRFTVALDYRGGIPGAFNLNGGEQGIVFAHNEPVGNAIWLAFAALDPAQSKIHVTPLDSILLRIKHYSIKADLREVRAGRLSVESAIDAEVLRDGVQAIPFDLNEGLGEYNDTRLKKSLRCEWVKLAGAPVTFVQEPWESGLTVFLTAPLAQGAAAPIAISASGEAMLRPGDAQYQRAGYAGMDKFEDVFYPLSTTSWYPTHGFLQRSTFDLVFLHRDAHTVISIGDPYEVKGSSEKGEKATGWKMTVPVALASFAVGKFDRTEREGKGSAPSVEYNSPTSFGPSAENFMLTELSNDAAFFSELFGPCPFHHISAVVHPRGFGQGFPSLLFLAPTLQRTNTGEFSFFAHEMAHQWWGHVVGWKSYRDQWMSEGFAQYSALIYVKARQDRDAQLALIHRMRKSLLDPPHSELGVGKGRVVDLGPIILGLRAATPQTVNGYYSLVYTKGALVLRMIHFLLSQPANGDDKAFFVMMKDFAARYAGGAASTEDFFALASEHFRQSPIAQKYGLQNLNWFYQQWVTQAALPSYRMEYAISPQGNGVLLSGTVYQENAPDDWIMPLPLAIHFGKGQEAHGTIEAKGEKTTFSIPLPMKPSSVVLDPDFFVLSEKTESVNTGGK